MTHPFTPTLLAETAAIMEQDLSGSDWAAKRGDRWLAYVAGMEAMQAPMDASLIQALRLVAPVRIADVGCGGGGTTISISRQAPPGSTVRGFDISPKLIEHARARVGSQGPSFEVADVAATLPEAPFDRIVSRFGVMFFADPAAAFANLSRWLRPGGRFAFAVWAPPADNRWISIAREVVAGVVAIPPTEADSPGPFRYADADRLLRLLADAGFAELGVEDWRGALAIGGGLPPAEAARFAIAAFANFGELLARAGDAALAQAQRSLAERFIREQRDGRVTLSARVHVVTGVRLAQGAL